MSIRDLDRVWKYSRQRGSKFLLLLAIADYTNQKGNAFPAVKTLAKKMRLSDRQVSRLISSLADTKELKVLKKRGPHGTNIYRINLWKNKAKRLKPFTSEQGNTYGGRHKHPYYSYINSKEWKKKSKHFRNQVNYKCAVCGKRSKPKDSHCHHNNYDYLGHEIEHPECIVVLCWGCHTLFETNRGGIL